VITDSVTTQSFNFTKENIMYKSLLYFTRILLIAGALALTQNVLAQGFDPKFDEDCDPIVPTIPAQCQPIVDQIEALTSELARLQDDLIKFPNNKAANLKQIKALEAKIRKLNAALEACEKNNAGPSPQGRPIAPSELNQLFSGTATLRTSHPNPQLQGPFFQSISVSLTFSRNRCVVRMTDFPNIQIMPTVPILGKVTVTVTKTGGGEGQFHPITGRMMIPLKLHFTYPVVSDDNAWFELTTGTSISPAGKFNVTGQTLQGDGSIILVGTTSFMDGYLSPNDGSLVVSGTITPLGGQGGPLPPQCQKIADEIAALEREISALQDTLISAPPTAKPQILQQIKTLQAELSKKQTALKNCK
jgi:hypothetical protein